MAGRQMVGIAFGLALLMAGCTTVPSSDTESQKQVQKQTVTNNVVNGLITVKAGAYNYYSPTFTAGAENPRLVGTFTASGGSGNDIIVYVMDQTAFVNYQNGHQVQTYYSSGKLTTASIEARLPNGAGTYYLVYDNTFSTFSDKNVNTRVDAIAEV